MYGDRSGEFVFGSRGLEGLKWLKNEGTAFALPTARPSRGSDDHVTWRSCLQGE